MYLLRHLTAIRDLHRIFVAAMASLSDLPIEVIQDNLSAFLSAKDLVHLACTNKVNSSELIFREAAG